MFDSSFTTVIINLVHVLSNSMLEIRKAKISYRPGFVEAWPDLNLTTTYPAGFILYPAVFHAGKLQQNVDMADQKSQHINTENKYGLKYGCHLLVRGIVSRVQTALPSIRNRLRNLCPGFHPIY